MDSLILCRGYTQVTPWQRSGIREAIQDQGDRVYGDTAGVWRGGRRLRSRRGWSLHRRAG